MPKPSQYLATISWKREGPDFRKGKYSRKHTWAFDSGQVIAASPSPHVVPAPWSDTAAVDPEEALVAAIASCHMLTFLWLASKEGFQADSYEDHAVGIMEKNDLGKWWVSQVTLSPQITWSGENIPASEDVKRLHNLAHEECYIAQSVKTKVSVKGDRDQAS